MLLIILLAIFRQCTLYMGIYFILCLSKEYIFIPKRFQIADRGSSMAIGVRSAPSKSQVRIPNWV